MAINNYQFWCEVFEAGAARAGVRELERQVQRLRGSGDWPGIPMQLEMIATFQHGIIDSRIMPRVEQGQAEWGAAEAYRTRAERFFDERGMAAEQEIRRDLDRARTIAARQGALSFELRAAISLATMLAGRPGESAALNVLAGIRARFREGFDTQDLVQADRLLRAKPMGNLVAATAHRRADDGLVRQQRLSVA